MAHDPFLLAERSIVQLGLNTPLLVPSFSSRGFPDVAALYERLHDDLYGVCLVSAFDVASRRLSVQMADVADLVVLDSGVYETTPVIVAADGYRPPPAAVDWTRNDYRDLLRTVDAAANVVAVSFDHYGPLEQQVRLAREDLACAPMAVGDFLVKPRSVTGVGSVIDSFPRPDESFAPLEALTSFGVIGITERELGVSLFDRCAALVRIRKLLGNLAVTLPIHVFGSITPEAVLAYFFCGADVFDGLNWLRFTYTAEGLHPIPESALAADQWAQPDEVRLVDQARRNLRFLHRLQEAMRRYAKTGDFDPLAAAFPAARAAARVALAAGSHLPGDRLE